MGGSHRSCFSSVPWAQDPAVQFNKFKRGEEVDLEKARRYSDNWHKWVWNLVMAFFRTAVDMSWSNDGVLLYMHSYECS